MTDPQPVTPTPTDAQTLTYNWSHTYDQGTAYRADADLGDWFLRVVRCPDDTWDAFVIDQRTTPWDGSVDRQTNPNVQEETRLSTLKAAKLWAESQVPA